MFGSQTFGPFISHIRQSLSAMWSKFDPIGAAKHAVDTLNSFGLSSDHIEAIATEVIAISKADISSFDKAVKVAEQIDTWTGAKALPEQATESLHAIITLVHLVAKLTGKL